MALSLTGSRGGDMMSERVKMTCPGCGYQCVPQWLNDEASCLKCFTTLRRRASGAGVGAGVAIHDTSRRMPGEACTIKMAPSSAMESEGGQCAKSPNGPHLFRFGKCSYCAKPEPAGQRSLATRPTPTPVRASSRSGSKPRADAGRYNFSLNAEAHDDVLAVPPAGARPRSSSRSSSCASQPRSGGHDHEAFPLFPEPAHGEGAKQFGSRNDRTKVECIHCGYKSVPQWLNDRAHCLKCQAVLKVQDSIHSSGGGASASCGFGGARRVSGEVSTFKVAPGDAMLHSSGSCARSPDGQHLWRFGKCDYCAVAEGKILGGGGACANPGASSGGCAAGGKCMFKFAKCSKCGRKEF
mmetsp:Transcript_86595/g.250054  ORF Transcript_86595/g.250054 Transcript_86595/m.250054 type:complete len:353 (-) Transcript_86595:72-1130(-)